MSVRAIVLSSHKFSPHIPVLITCIEAFFDFRWSVSLFNSMQMPSLDYGDHLVCTLYKVRRTSTECERHESKCANNDMRTSPRTKRSLMEIFTEGSMQSFALIRYIVLY